MKEKKYFVSKSLLYMKKKGIVLMMTIKNIIESEIIVIILGNIEELNIVFVI